MPFDDRAFPGLDAHDDRRRRGLIATWLFAVAGMIWGMVVLGGATRLTGSGLSIMEWAPLSGALPPLSHAAWQHYFDLYRAIPQYRLLHPDMDLAGFQQIFWLEWTHRNWGRLTGVVFAVPLLVLAIRGMITRALALHLAGLLILGGMQGFIGWFMVASGFFLDSVAVSPYRLVVHLSLALALFAAVLWTALGVLTPYPPGAPGARWLRRLAVAALVCVAFTIVAGGFTAGTHAGLIDNSFPQMDGRLFPAGYLDPSLHPAWRNAFENVIAVQFDHRVLATLTISLVLATSFAGCWVAWRGLLRPGQVAALAWLAGAAATQYLLGIAALLAAVALPLAVLHQACAVILLAAALCAVHSLRRAT